MAEQTVSKDRKPQTYKKYLLVEDGRVSTSEASMRGDLVEIVDEFDTVKDAEKCMQFRAKDAVECAKDIPLIDGGDYFSSYVIYRVVKVVTPRLRVNTKVLYEEEML